MTELSRFTVLPTIGGFDVIDEATGHAVDHRDTAQQANGVVYRLNSAVREGRTQNALGCNPSDPRDPLVAGPDAARDSIRAQYSDPVGHSRRELSDFIHYGEGF